MADRDLLIQFQGLCPRRSDCVDRIIIVLLPECVRIDGHWVAMMLVTPQICTQFSHSCLLVDGWTMDPCQPNNTNSDMDRIRNEADVVVVGVGVDCLAQVVYITWSGDIGIGMRIDR